MTTRANNTVLATSLSWLIAAAVSIALTSGYVGADDQADKRAEAERQAQLRREIVAKAQENIAAEEKVRAERVAADAERRLQVERIEEEKRLKIHKEAMAAAQRLQTERLNQLAADVAVSDDDYEEPAISELRANVHVPAQPRMGAAVGQFVQIVFGGYQGNVFGAAGNQLEFLLQARLSTAELVCGLTLGQKQKLQLAGRGDIKHLLDEIQVQFAKCELLDTGVKQPAPEDVLRIARSLRDSLETGPFGSGSLFVKTLGRVLTGGQPVQYKKYLALEQLGGRMHLRPRGDDEIKALRMTKATLTDEGMVPLAGLTGLKSLNLDYTQVTDAGLAHLESLTSLEVLEMEGTQVRGPGLVHLHGMQSLQVLDLRRSKVDDAALVHLRGLAALKVLQLHHTRVAGAGLVHLAELPNLETLLLVQTPLSDAGLAGLAALTRLKELNLEGTEVTDAGLPHIAKMTGLVTLDLRRTRVTDAGLGQLRGLKNLQAVYLFGTPVTASGAAELERELPETRVVR